MKKMFVLLFGLTLFFSCNINNENRTEEVSVNDTTATKVSIDDKIKLSAPSSKIGRYVYMDKGKCLHIKLDCYSLRRNSTNILLLSTLDENAELRLSSNKYAIQRILTEELTENNIVFCCKDCVNDDLYDSLLYVIRN